MKLNVASFAIAAAIVAHPFITKAVEGFGQYPDYDAAEAACEEWKEKGEDRFCSFYRDEFASQRHWYEAVKGEESTQTLTRYYY